MAQYLEKSSIGKIMIYTGIASIILVQFLFFWNFWFSILSDVDFRYKIRILGILGFVFSFIMMIWSFINLFFLRKINTINIMVLIMFLFIVIISLVLLYKSFFSIHYPSANNSLF